MRRGLARGRDQARRLVAEGRVLVGGAPADKPARQVDPGEPVEVLGPPPRFVGRAGEKLAAALEGFEVDVRGLRVLDAGASTGGFTDCLLQHGAAQVVAVDVGRGQLHERLLGDERVVALERTNVRGLEPEDVGGRVEAVTADLSFISLEAVLDALLGLCHPDAPLLLLVKPQFEAGREEATRARGVVTDPEVHRRVLHEVNDALARRGASIMGVMASPIRGARGNVEYLLHARAWGDAPRVALSDAEIDAAVAAGRGVC